MNMSFYNFNFYDRSSAERRRQREEEDEREEKRRKEERNSEQTKKHVEHEKMHYVRKRTKEELIAEQKMMDEWRAEQKAKAKKAVKEKEEMEKIKEMIPMTFAALAAIILFAMMIFM